MSCCGAPVVGPEQRSKTFGLHTYGQTFGAELGMQACMVVQGIITARALAPAGRGELAALLLWPRVLGWIGLGGTNITISRRAASGERLGPLSRTALLCALVGSVLALAAGIVAE